WIPQCSLNRHRGKRDAIDAETFVVEQFKQRAHLSLPTSREPDTELEWLALIQHHGGPTRLVDFTRSPFVGAFFAIENDDQTGGPHCALLGVDEFECRRRAVKRI